MALKNPYFDALSLPVSERLALLEYIWDSIVDHPEAVELTAQQRQELDARLDSYRRDGVGGDAWSIVKARILGRS